MLRVQIGNIDGNLSGIFEIDDPQKAAEAALASLIKNDGFFAENRICNKYPPSFTPSDGVIGFLVMPDNKIDDLNELEYKVDSENTFWVTVKPVEFGKMFW